MPDEKNSPVSRMAYIGLAVPGLIYVWAFLKYETNMPLWDDYGAVLVWSSDFLNTHALGGKILLIFQQYNEHRIVLDHLVTLLSIAMLHRIDFTFLSFVGSIALFGIAAMMLYIGKRIGLSKLELIPIVFLLFNLEQNQLIYCAMAGLQQYWQLLFDILSILFLTISARKLFLVLACAAAVMATFCGGGGLLVFPVGLIYLVAARNWRYVICWSLVAVFSLYLFFVYFDYRPVPSSAAAHAYFLSHPALGIGFVLGFLGNYGYSPAMAIGFGLLSLAVLATVIARNFRTTNATLKYIAWFMLASAFTVAASRLFLGLQECLVSRYAIYGLLNLAVTYMIVISAVAAGRLRYYLNFAAILVSVMIYAAWLGPSIRMLGNIHRLEEWYLVFASETIAGETLQTAMQDGIFYPALLYKHLPAAIKDNPKDYAAWRELFGIYLTRPDLEKAFHLTAGASYEPLLHWAAIGIPNYDPAFAQITPLQPVYKSMLSVFPH